MEILGQRCLTENDNAVTSFLNGLLRVRKIIVGF